MLAFRFIVIILLPLTIHPVLTPLKDLEEICTEFSSKTFSLYIERTDMDFSFSYEQPSFLPKFKKIEFNIQESFFKSKKRKGGNGHGATREIHFPLSGLPTSHKLISLRTDGEVTVWNAVVSPFLLRELEVMRAMTRDHKQEILLGCQFNEQRQTVFLVRSNLDHYLNEPVVLGKFNQLSNYQRVRYYAQILEKIQRVHDLGYIMGYIQTENIGYTPHNDEMSFVSFALALEIGKPYPCLHRDKYFFSPKCEKGKVPRSDYIDDLYSWAIMIGEIEAYGKAERVFMTRDSFNKKTKNFRIQKAKNARQVYAINIQEILRDRGFQSAEFTPINYQPVMNFAALLKSLVLCEDFQMSFEEVRLTLDDILRGLKAAEYLQTSVDFATQLNPLPDNQMSAFNLIEMG